MKTKQVIFEEKQLNIQQIFFYKSQGRCIIFSRESERGDYKGLVIFRQSGPLDIDIISYELKVMLRYLSYAINGQNCLQGWGGGQFMPLYYLSPGGCWAR